MTTLDQYIQKNAVQKIDFIKCDVDGAEVRFLKGARKTISTQKPIIIIEASSEHGRDSCYEIFTELSKADYAFFSLHYKRMFRPIEAQEFKRRFKENILCIPVDKLNILSELA